MKYIKELDSIRAIAVLAVIASHWLTIRNPFISKLLHYGGPIGVDIFFVLSGFLITWILLENYKKVQNGNAGRGRVLKNFYVRRTLRIFPIYYLVIFTLLLFSVSSGTSIATSYPYYLTYTSNFYFFINGQFDGILSHMWSLAVEEQFYLIWPSLLLFASTQYQRYIIYTIIGIGIVSQLLLHYNNMASVLTVTCFDAFGMGALLAWHIVFSPDSLPKFYRLVQKAAIVALPLFVLGLVQNKWQVMPLLRTIISVLTLFAITYIVYKKSVSQKLSFNFIWNNRVLIFLGKISYGIYIYHNLIPHYTSKVLTNTFHATAENMLPYKMGYLVMLGINSIILIGIAWLSWLLIEKPVLQLKKYFEYTTSSVNTQTM